MANIAAKIEEEQKQALVKYCKDRGMTISGLIMVALREYFKNQEKKD